MRLVDKTFIDGGSVRLYGAYYAGLRDSSVRIIDSLPVSVLLGREALGVSGK